MIDRWYHNDSMVTNKNIKSLRKEYGFSQQELADRLGMSRPTLVKVESGERSLTVPEQRKLEEVFGVATSLKQAERSDIRINIPQKKLEKFKQVLLYITEQVGGHPNVGMTVLYKLLYFADFDYYEKYEEQLMGLTYIKNTYGPTPREFVKVVEDMKMANELVEVRDKHFKHDQRKFLPVVKPDLSILTGRELEMIDDVLARYADKSATELSTLSHLDTPWACADMGEDIQYEHVFYRSEQFSVREYDEL